ncbi:MAG: hypothetical protein F6K19_10465 [Cyanothece sp. SIO1E1]|nr:hypothetical protein [Cyanothece sp. SIO1E1]
MKLNPAVAFTLILLSLMFGAGIVSAAWGYALGREALRGITQPDSRPSSSLANRGEELPRHEELVIVSEEDLLKNVKARMEGNLKSVDEGNASR